MDFYETDTKKVWMQRLLSEWYKISGPLYRQGIDLDNPSFEITSERWGKYYRDSNSKPVISLSRHLFNNFGWGAVIHVLKHETAHYIVDVKWQMGDLDSHGEAFKRACKVLNIDDKRCCSAKQLLEEDARLANKEQIVIKIKKIMALSTSSAKAEAETALRKAEELMLKHNITTLDEHESDEYLFRPVGPVCGRMPNYIRDLSNIVSEYYFVNHILCYHGPRQRYFEFFGTKENLDLAEYIFCCLLHQGERLWDEHATELKRQYGGTRGIASKAEFLEGLYSGYKSKLRIQKDERESTRGAINAESLIWTGDPLLKEMYRKTYPNVKTYLISRNANGGGYGDGYKAGKSLSLNAGLHSGNSGISRGKLLNR